MIRCLILVALMFLGLAFMDSLFNDFDVLGERILALEAEVTTLEEITR